MKNHKKLPILFLLICISSIPVFSQDCNNNLPTKGVFWKISGNGLEKPSYLLGTLHLPKGKAILDSIPGILKTLENVDCFVPEADCLNIRENLTTKQDTSANIIKLKPWSSSDSTYQDLLNKEQYEKILNTKILSKEVLELRMESNRPLNLLYWLKQESNYRSNPSRFPQPKDYPTDSLYYVAVDSFEVSRMIFDVFLQKIATYKYKKEVAPLETPAEQFNAINLATSKLIPSTSLSYKDEIDLLMYYVENHAEIDSIGKATMDLFTSHYLNQNLDYMDISVYYSDSPFILSENKQEAVAILIDNRNNIWMEKIPNLIQAKSCFIAVGAAHLVNESGLINQLRKLGYSVERIE